MNGTGRGRRCGMDKTEEWAKHAAYILKKNMTPEEIEVIKTEKEISLQIAGPIRPLQGVRDSYSRLLIKAENAANKVLNDYYTNLIRKYL